MLIWVGDINAGFPSPAEGYEDQPLNIHELLVKNEAATFYFRVNGDSLNTEYVRHGSILVVDKSLANRANLHKLIGRLVVGEHSGQTVVCRLRRGYPALVVGVVVGVVMVI
jgi:DNA polymerase V